MKNTIISLQSTRIQKHEHWTVVISETAVYRLISDNSQIRDKEISYRDVAFKNIHPTVSHTNIEPVMKKLVQDEERSKNFILFGIKERKGIIEESNHEEVQSTVTRHFFNHWRGSSGHWVRESMGTDCRRPSSFDKGFSEELWNSFAASIPWTTSEGRKAYLSVQKGAKRRGRYVRNLWMRWMRRQEETQASTATFPVNISGKRNSSLPVIATTKSEAVSTTVHNSVESNTCTDSDSSISYATQSRKINVS